MAQLLLRMILIFKIPKILRASSPMTFIWSRIDNRLSPRRTKPQKIKINKIVRTHSMSLELNNTFLYKGLVILEVYILPVNKKQVLNVDLWMRICYIWYHFMIYMKWRKCLKKDINPNAINWKKIHMSNTMIL